MSTPLPISPATYTPHAGLPPLAGIASFAEAAQPGLSVEESVNCLKRHHYVLKRLMQIFQARLIAEPLYELKMAFSLHSHYCAEHASACRQRVAEMRTPPLGLDKVPHEALAHLFDEIQGNPHTAGLLLGIYEVVVPSLVKALKAHRAAAHPLADHPSIRLLRFAVLELEEVEAYGMKAVAALVESEQRTSLQSWTQLLGRLLAAAGGLDGTSEAMPHQYTAVYGSLAGDLKVVPARDARFPDPYNMGVHAEEFLYNANFRDRDKTLMMYYKRLREIDVPEVMAAILSQTKDKPWNYYRDMTRQLWDEARHAMMGEVGFVANGIDWGHFVKVNFTWSLGLNTQLEPWERHAVLYFIEQGLMTRTGKRFEWEVGANSGDALAKTFQDFDWADEVLHAHIGKEWYVSAFGSQKGAIEFGSACWSKVLTGWQEWKDKGFTTHENWWPALYAEFCRVQKLEPDAAAHAYDVTYEASRADLEKLPMSA